MDLRKRVAKAWAASGDADAVAATVAISRWWVHRLLGRGVKPAPFPVESRRHRRSD